MLDISAGKIPTPSPPSWRRLGNPAREVLDALAGGAPIEARACVVVAHPDDETVGLGARLAGFRRLRLIHLTDGSPENPADAERAGFGDGDAYREARSAELAEALAALGAAPGRIALGVGDQQAAHHLAWLAQVLAPQLAACDLVVTHAYEGGHPDHDAAAFAVQVACARLARQGRHPPGRLEFAGYHLDGGRRVTGAFWPDPARPSVAARMTAAQLARKRRALSAFRTQAEVIAWFSPTDEAYREAPDYDFTAPPPPGAALYDQWGWPLTSARWQGLAAAALAELGGVTCA
jgi:LmbE family N-acetylglucosaminyl deacetylase